MPGDVTLKLYGAAKLLGTWSLPAGQTEGQFDFPVNAADAIPQMHAGSFLETTARRSFH